MTRNEELAVLRTEQIRDRLDDYRGVSPESPDHINLHPNQLDGLGCGDPEDALNELIDLKHGYMDL